MRTLWRLAACFALSSCAQPTATRPAPTRSAHPRAQRARSPGGARGAALLIAQSRAERCLGAGDGVGIEGTFDGPTGRFRVHRVVGFANPEVEQCVTSEFEEARVEPFATVAQEESWFITAPGISADAREAIYQTVYGIGREEDPRGAIDTSAVTAMIRQESAAIRGCYEGGRVTIPTLAGSVRVRMRIGLNGRVDRAVSDAPPELRPVADCIVTHLRSLTWPRPRRAAVTFLLPFTFSHES